MFQFNTNWSGRITARQLTCRRYQVWFLRSTASLHRSRIMQTGPHQRPGATYPPPPTPRHPDQPAVIFAVAIKIQVNTGGCRGTRHRVSKDNAVLRNNSMQWSILLECAIMDVDPPDPTNGRRLLLWRYLRPCWYNVARHRAVSDSIRLSCCVQSG